MENLQVNEAFCALWRNEVKELAKICAPTELFTIVKKEEKEITNTDLQTLQDSQIQDVNAIFYIGHMISDVERSILKNRYTLDSLNSMQQIQGCLTSESYWQNVWKNDVSSDEARNLKRLGEAMTKLIKKM